MTSAATAFLAQPVIMIGSQIKRARAQAEGTVPTDGECVCAVCLPFVCVRERCAACWGSPWEDEHHRTKI